MYEIHTSDTVNFASYDQPNSTQFRLGDLAPLDIGINVPSPAWHSLRVRWRKCIGRTPGFESVAVVGLETMMWGHIISCDMSWIGGRDKKGDELLFQLCDGKMFFEIHRSVHAHDIQLPSITHFIRRGQYPLTSRQAVVPSYPWDHIPTHFVMTPLQETTPISPNPPLALILLQASNNPSNRPLSSGRRIH